MLFRCILQTHQSLYCSQKDFMATKLDFDFCLECQKKLFPRKLLILGKKFSVIVQKIFVLF